jgi:hypothetical protein
MRVFIALCIGTLIAIGYSISCNEGPASLLVIGDLPGFYGLGRIVLEGKGPELFNIELQREIQNRFWPAMSGTVLFTLYPPFVAGVMALVAWMPPRILQILFAAASIALLAWSVREEAKDRRLERLSLILFSLPVLLGVVGIQNTALSIALIVATRKLLRDNRDLAAGMVAGALLYKPHVGLLFVALAAVSARINFLRGVVLVALLEYVVGVMIVREEWLGRWMTEVRSFSAARSGVDGYQMTSILNALGSPAAPVWEVACLLGCFAFLSIASYIKRHEPRAVSRIVDLFLVSFPLFVPQTMFYDLGISIFILFTRIPLTTSGSLRVSVFAVLALNTCVWFREAPLTLVPLAALLVASHALIVARVSLRRAPSSTV